MDRASSRLLCHALAGVLTAVGFAAQCLAAPDEQKVVTGYVEWIRIQPGDFVLQARIDTGATHSSLNAENLHRFTRDGKPWVRFSLVDQSNRSGVIEGPVQRTARIRRHGGEVQKREVLLLGICLGPVFKTVEVNVVDRAGFEFQMLVGRSFLGEDFLVDPSRRLLLEPVCPKSR